MHERNDEVIASYPAINRSSVELGNSASSHQAPTSTSAASAAVTVNPDTPPLEALLDVNQAAKILGISPKTLRDHVFHRRIPHVKLFGRVLFTPKMLWDVIDSHTVQARLQ